MGKGQDYAAQLRVMFPGAASSGIPSTGQQHSAFRDIYDWAAYQQYYGGMSPQEAQSYLKGGSNPYGEMAMSLASAELDARKMELAYQKQMMDQLLPLEMKAREQEIANATARQQWEEQVRGFISPITQGQGLGGMYSNLGQPASQDEIDYYFRSSTPKIKEALTSAGLSQSGDFQRRLEALAGNITAADIPRARNEQMGLIGMTQGLPYTSNTQANVSYTGSNPYQAMNTGYGMYNDQLQNQMSAANQMYSMDQMNAYNRSQPSMMTSLLGGIGGTFLGSLAGGLGSGLGGSLATKMPWFKG